MACSFESKGWCDEADTRRGARGGQRIGVEDQGDATVAKHGGRRHARDGTVVQVQPLDDDLSLVMHRIDDQRALALGVRLDQKQQ